MNRDRNLRQKFAKLLADLSPENLHEDGEISAEEAEVKYVRIMKEWKELVAKATRFNPNLADITPEDFLNQDVRLADIPEAYIKW